MHASPDFSQPQHLHRRTLIYRALLAVPYLLVAVYFAWPIELSWTYFGERIAPILGFIIVIPILIVRYYFFTYQITNQEVIIAQGVLSKQHRSIPIERIQNIEIQQNFLHRWLGIARVRFETAGSSGSEGLLEFVQVDVGRLVRQEVRRRQAGESAPDPVTTAPTAEQAPVVLDDDLAGTTLLHAMPQKHVLLRGVFQFSMVYIGVAFGLLQTMGIQVDEMIEWGLEPFYDTYLAASELPAWVLITVPVLIVLFLGWLTGFLVQVNRYWDFAIYKGDRKLHKRHGLLSRTEGSIALSKVQLLLYRANWLMRYFRWVKLELQTVGVDPKQRGSQVALPLARPDLAQTVAQDIRTFPPPTAYQSVSRLHIRRLMIRYTLLVAVPVAVGVYFWDPVVLWGATLLPVLFLIAYGQYRHHGYALTEDFLYIRRGLFTHQQWVVPLDKGQVFYTRANIFQRRLGLKTVEVDVAGGSWRDAIRIVDLENPVADETLSTIYHQFQQQFTA